MTPPNARTLAMLLVTASGLAGCASLQQDTTGITQSTIGRYQISTVPFDAGLHLRSATYTPSGSVLVTYDKDKSQSERHLTLATMDDDGRNLRTFFSGIIPERPKDNGLRLMIFPDDKRIFLGDFVIECSTSLETCKDAALLPVRYPPEVADGDYISHRWSEVVVAPDNRHVAWNALLSDYSVAVFTGELQKTGNAYEIVHPQIVSTPNPFRPDPDHPDGVLPQPLRGGEVKQFVHGGTALSMVGAVRRDVPDSVALDLNSGKTKAVTDTPGYTETTIFSPDEKLGITMSSRFSPSTDPAVLGLMPRPYPDSLNIGVSMLAYTYAVTGVRIQRPGSIGPALIDIQASKTQEGYQGIDLNTQDEWVFHSPMSWSPDGKKAMWIEGLRGSQSKRIQIVTLPDYRPARPVAATATPDKVPYGSADLSQIKAYAKAAQNIDVKVYGRKSGYLTYRRTPGGIFEKAYFDYSDDGQSVYSGHERLQANPGGRSTYTADLRLTGPRAGAMNLQMTFGPLGGPLPAQLIFSPDANGLPLSRGFAEYDGHRLDVSTLVP